MNKKHLPTRTCVACRRIKPKQDLTRIVRRPDGIVELDESGKANGRGCYVCQNFTCWHKTLRKRATLLKRTLKTDFDRETYLVLKKFAMRYKPRKEKQTEEATNAENKASGEGTPDAGTPAENSSDAAVPADNGSNVATPADSASDKQAQEEKPAENRTEEKS